MMTAHLIKKKIDDWQQKIAEVETQIDALNAVLGVSPESDFISAIHDVLSAYTDAVARDIGDTDDWLDWWWLEWSLGVKGGAEVTLPGYGKRTIANTKDLAELIVDCSIIGDKKA
jgi:hypothetical protein